MVGDLASTKNMHAPCDLQNLAHLLLNDQNWYPGFTVKVGDMAEGFRDKLRSKSQRRLIHQQESR